LRRDHLVVRSSSIPERASPILSRIAGSFPPARCTDPRISRMQFHSPARAASVAFVLVLAALPCTARAQAPIAADGSAVGITRFEMQRGLLEIDEQRRRLELSLEPVDSVLRVLAADTLKIASLKRSPAVDQDAALVASLGRQLRMYPADPDLTARLIDAVTTTARDFSLPDHALGSRVLPRSAAQDLLVRSPNAAVIVVDDTLPPYDTSLWNKVGMSDFGRRQLPRVTLADVNGFTAAVSDTGFAAYRAELMSATMSRIAEVRQTRDSTRAEIQRLRRRAGDLAHLIGSQDEVQAPDGRVIMIGIPTFAIILLALLLVPRAYRSIELQQWLFQSGVLLEFTTLVLIVAGVLLLALAGRIGEAVIGTVMGSVLGYGVGRGVGRRAESPVRVVTAHGEPATVVRQTPLTATTTRA